MSWEEESRSWSRGEKDERREVDSASFANGALHGFGGQPTVC